MNFNKLINAIIFAVLMATAIGCASTETERGTGEYIDDSVITTKVKAALIREEETKARDINVTTFKGVVQLSGFVDSASQKARAVTITQRVKGVKSVKDKLIVK